MSGAPFLDIFHFFPKPSCKARERGQGGTVLQDRDRDKDTSKNVRGLKTKMRPEWRQVEAVVQWRSVHRYR